MTADLRADIRYIVEEEMRRVVSVNARIDSCTERLADLFGSAHTPTLPRPDPASDKIIADLRSIIAVLPAPERQAA